MGLLNQGLEDKVYQKLQGILEQYPEDQYVEVANRLVENKQINISEAYYLAGILACYMTDEQWYASRWYKLEQAVEQCSCHGQGMRKTLFRYAVNLKAGLSVNGEDVIKIPNSKYYIEYNDDEIITLYFRDYDSYCKLVYLFEHLQGFKFSNKITDNDRSKVLKTVTNKEWNKYIKCGEWFC